MSEKTRITVTQLIEVAHSELLRLDYRQDAMNRYVNGLSRFLAYCEKNGIQEYQPQTGSEYFTDLYGSDIADVSVKLTQAQLDTRAAIRLLDDIYQFGYAHRYSHHEYGMSSEHTVLLEDYLQHCRNNHASSGTIRVKKAKIQQFLAFLKGRRIALADITSADLSGFMRSLCRYKRATLHVFSSVLKDFLRYLHQSGYIQTDLSGSVPRPRIYVEEDIPQTWSADEVRKLLTVINRSCAIGKRDYAMILLAATLGMRAGDICALKFRNLDWNRKLIVYVQQKTGKAQQLPLLPAVGEAIIDYLKNGRLESHSDCVFLKHIPPYGEFQSSTPVSQIIKKYMRQAGIPIKKRKAAHSLRHTLASGLLRDGTPLITISNILGHAVSQTTVGYMKVHLDALRKCALSYGEQEDFV